MSDDLARHLARFPAPALLGRLLLARGVRDVETARRFLQPSLARDLGSPVAFDGLDEAVAAVLGCGGPREVVAAQTGAGLLAGIAFVDGAGRLGFSVALRLDAAAAGVGIGVGGGRRVACGRPSGRPGDVLVAPRQGEAGTLADLGVAGVVLYLLVALRAASLGAGSARADLRPIIDLVSLATLLEGVPLQGENRVLVRRGMQLLGGLSRPGLRAIVEAAMAWPPTAARLIGRLGPRLDAAARACAPASSVELLTTADPVIAARLASELEVVAACGPSRNGLAAPLVIDEVDAEWSLSALTPAVSDALDLLEPHGAGNPEVVLLARSARVDGIRLVGGPDRPQCVLRLRQDGRTVRAVSPGAVGARALQGATYDVVYRARRGQGRAEIEVLTLESPGLLESAEVADSIVESVVS